MRQRNLARPRMQAAAHQSRHAGGVVRRPKWPPVGERAAFERAGDGRHHGDFEELGRRQRRQDGRQARRQHGFAGAGRAHHEKIMAAGRGHFERALGAFLPLDVGKVEGRTRHIENLWYWPRQHLAAFEMVGELDQRGGRDDLDVGARPGRFRSAGRRAHQAFAAGIGADGGRQHAGNRRNRAVKAEFAQHREARESIMRDGADRRHQAERDRQVVMAAFLGQIGGRQIDGDAAGRQRQSRGDHGRTHPLPRLRDGLIGQAHDGHCIV